MSVELTDHEKAIYEWQMWTSGFGEAGQKKLKAASVLISRCGGVGGVVAQQLCAAGVGELVIAHGGNLKKSDLHRQILMTDDWVGKPRIESIARRLRELNPRVAIHAVDENISEENVAELVERADVIVDCAPLFTERFLLNRESVLQRKPLVEAAMYEFEAHLTTFIPARTPCLACLYPTMPTAWKREFPVFGAVAGTIGSLAAVEVIKLISGLGQSLLNKLLVCDLGSMTFSTLRIRASLNCAVCSSKITP